MIIPGFAGIGAMTISAAWWSRDREMFKIAITLIALFWTVTAHADDEEIIATGKEAVAAKLINPDSARFTDVRLTTNHGQQYVCGHVSAKDRRGATTTSPSSSYPTKKLRSTPPSSTTGVL
jgi:hypothetical protein